MFCYASYINNVPFFNIRTKGLSGYKLRRAIEEAHHFVTQVAMMIIPRAYPPNETVVKVNEPAKAMFMIKRGIVAFRGQVIGKGGYVAFEAGGGF